MGNKRRRPGQLRMPQRKFPSRAGMREIEIVQKWLALQTTEIDRRREIRPHGARSWRRDSIVTVSAVSRGRRDIPHCSCASRSRPRARRALGRLIMLPMTLFCHPFPARRSHSTRICRVGRTLSFGNRVRPQHRGLQAQRFPPPRPATLPAERSSSSRAPVPCLQFLWMNSPSQSRIARASWMPRQLRRRRPRSVESPLKPPSVKKLKSGPESTSRCKVLPSGGASLPPLLTEW